MRDSLTLAGKAGRDVETWIASLTEIPADQTANQAR